MAASARIQNITENLIEHTRGRYYYELDDIILSRDKFNASDKELEERILPYCILPNKEKFYFNDSARSLVSAIFRNGGKVYSPIHPKTGASAESP